MKHLYDRYGRYLPSEDRTNFYDTIISTTLPIVIDMVDKGYSKTEVLTYITEILNFEELSYRLTEKLKEIDKNA